MLSIPWLLSWQVTHAQGLIITSGTNLVANGNVQLVLNDGGITNNGTFTKSTSTFIFTGSSANSFIAGSSTTDFYNLTINKSTFGLTLNSQIAVSNLLDMISVDSLFLNNYTINLGTTGSLNGESATKRITGRTGGYIEAIRTLNAPSNSNPGNLGAVISSAANMGSTIVRRGHVTQANGSVFRYFDIMPTNNTGLDASLNFYYQDAELNGNTEATLDFFYSTDGGLNWTYETKLSGNTSSNYVSDNLIDAFSRVTIATLVNVVLPMKVLSLKAQLKNDDIQLTWKTLQEDMNGRFEIERKQQNGSFTTIGQVSGKGPSVVEQVYTYWDQNPLPGQYSYRIKEIDGTGKISYSEQAMVQVNNRDGITLQVFPNPATHLIQLKFQQPSSSQIFLKLIDASGRVVDSKCLLPAQQQLQWDISKLQPGIYFITTSNATIPVGHFIKTAE
jgi:Secretion system C-terminal sorting domain